ncbi:MAG: class I SAM-dependent methyltransferase [Gammaproteobacteria bacterium]|nr:class I SAM-dependent methyltransferase [Gammaproteobacteria bacterium]
MTDIQKENKNNGDVDIRPQKLQWTPELVRKFWDGLTYTRLLELGFSRQAGRSLIIAIDHFLSRDSGILDFGAGDGDLIKFLCDRGYSATAYEQSGERNHSLNNLLNSHDNFLGIINENSDETFDVVIMAEVIEHILDSDLNNTLSRISSLITPGGVLVVTTPNNEDLELGMVYCPENNLLFHRWQHVRSFTSATLVELLSKYGVEEIVTHELELNDALYLQGDPVWGNHEIDEIPGFLNAIKQNKSVKLGSQQNLLFIGRKIK